MLADMRQALDQDNFAELSRLAHMFNANSASFGAVKLAEMARHIELMVSEDTVSGFDAILEHMTLHYHELRPILKQKGAELASSAQSIA
jgi:HPt (histidine-containing phosphotransfer) domain-containing protein